MGVEYAHDPIPEDNTYKPGPEDSSRLVNALLDGGFVARTDSDAFKKMAFETYTDYQFARETDCFVHLGINGYRSPAPCPLQRSLELDV